MCGKCKSRLWTVILYFLLHVGPMLFIQEIKLTSSNQQIHLVSLLFESTHFLCYIQPTSRKLQFSGSLPKVDLQTSLTLQQFLNYTILYIYLSIDYLESSDTDIRRPCLVKKIPQLQPVSFNVLYFDVGIRFFNFEKGCFLFKNILMLSI